MTIAHVLKRLLLVTCIGVPNSAMAQEFVMPVTSQKMHEVFTDFNKDNCGNFFGELDQSGIRQHTRAFRAFQANPPGYRVWLLGYENFLQKGADPAPCERVSLDAIEIAVQFNLSRVEERTVELGYVPNMTAFLSWEPVEFAVPHIRSWMQRRPYLRCTGDGFSVARSTQPWMAGLTTRRMPPRPQRLGDPGQLGERGDMRQGRMPATQRMTPSASLQQEPVPQSWSGSRPYPYRLQVEVTPIVRNWFRAPFRGAFPNNGIVLSPPAPPAFLERVNRIELFESGFRISHCWKALKDIRLRIVLDG